MEYIPTIIHRLLADVLALYIGWLKVFIPWYVHDFTPKEYKILFKTRNILEKKYFKILSMPIWTPKNVLINEGHVNTPKLNTYISKKHKYTPFPRSSQSSKKEHKMKMKRWLKGNKVAICKQGKDKIKLMTLKESTNASMYSPILYLEISFLYPNMLISM